MLLKHYFLCQIIIFLSRRFGNPDLLEKQAKESPLEIIKLLLKDLGPQCAADIKESLCDLVIPTSDWNRWWQNARAKMKKDRKIQSPKRLTEPFILREKEIDHEVILQQKLENKPKPKEIIQMVHSFLRDFSETLKKEEFKNSLIIKLLDVLSFEDLTLAQNLQIHFFLDYLKADKEVLKIKEILQKADNIQALIEDIDIISFKKRALVAIRKYKEDWSSIFLDLFFSLEQNILRDYLLGELIKSKPSELKEKIQTLLHHPLIYPIAFVWYFQKIFFTDQKDLPYADIGGKNKFFEGFLILLDHIENKPELRDLAKKMVNIITADRYKLVRDVLKHASIEEVKEYLLLATKCRLFDDHDIKIIHSLAKVEYASLGKYKEEEEEEKEDFIWATEKGLNKIKQRLNHLSTIEMIDNAKEIEEARAHGDLRENAEYKAALERRARIQGEIKLLSDQLNKAKILIKEEIFTDKVGVGTIVDCTNEKGKKQTFIILGPFEADADKNILSFQSKFANEMIGKTLKETFSFNGKKYTIVDIRNYFD